MLCRANFTTREKKKEKKKDNMLERKCMRVRISNVRVVFGIDASCVSELVNAACQYVSAAFPNLR